MDVRNWFDRGGADYARFRPGYPPELVDVLVDAAPDTTVAIDVGCGTGKLTVRLAERFDAVVGIDPSEDQLANAISRDRVRYVCAPAEHLPIDDHSVGLVTAAQAAHWFDLPAFHAEVRRVAKPGALLALISYGVLLLDGEPGVRLHRFHTEEIGPYWPPQRRLVDDGYRTIEFPFREVEAPQLSMRQELRLDDLLGYISTWSAVRAARESGQERLLTAFAEDLRSVWGDPALARTVVRPVNLRLGRL